jgi:hypothetical protein
MVRSFLGRPRKFLKVVIVIAKIVSLRKDGDETPQFYQLAVKYDGVGAPSETLVYGT